MEKRWRSKPESSSEPGHRKLQNRYRLTIDGRQHEGALLAAVQAVPDDDTGVVDAVGRDEHPSVRARHEVVEIEHPAVPIDECVIHRRGQSHGGVADDLRSGGVESDCIAVVASELTEILHHAAAVEECVRLDVL